MKSIHYITFILAWGLSACQEPGIRQALEQAGDNRTELQAVLDHYRDEPLKAQAARFLIGNMDAHAAAFAGQAVEEYGTTWTACSVTATATACSGS